MLERVTQFIEQIRSTLEEVDTTIHKFQDSITRYYNRHWVLIPIFNSGDKIYLDVVNIHTIGSLAKLAH